MNGFLHDEFRANASKLHKRIFGIVSNTFPAWKWGQEKTIFVNGKNLYVDIYCDTPVKIAIECHGRQHSEYVAHFHKNILAFNKAIALDRAKKAFLIEAGYTFIEFLAAESLSDKEIVERILSKMKEDS
jgi:very-short-patch-repair endonuclease